MLGILGRYFYEDFTDSSSFMQRCISRLREECEMLKFALLTCGLNAGILRDEGVRMLFECAKERRSGDASI
jgi:hypothetical protein